ncbi:MAG: SDR family NAD(P)-dependent oxidoreductase, partial [Gammaproteobacteria bacterium]|nr:SDR family NAD(P)-dependent oxidoreductase [Gammaproteobacteria bacterium]
MECRLDGKTALITGGSLGLGYAMAEAFAKAGAEVAIVARREEILTQSRDKIRALTQNRIEAYVCDVSV